MTFELDARLLHAPLFGRPEERDSDPAFLHGDAVLSYGELADSTRRGAAWLTAQGVLPGDRIAIALGKGLATVRLMFAGLAAGAVLVPIDHQAPPARIAALVQDSRPQLLFAPARLVERLDGQDLPAGLKVRVWEADHDWADLNGDTGLTAALPDLAADDAALLLYTSGTTGIPKAVVLSHANVTAFTTWAIARLDLGPSDRLAAHAPFYFDLSTLDLFGAVRARASTVLLDEVAVRFPARVSEILATAGVTVWYSVPTALVLLLHHGALEERDLRRLRLILFAGEPFPVPALRRLMNALPQARYVNLYGPTETNVCTYHVLEAPPSEDARAIPIGIPCEHLQVSILRPDATLAPAGEAGEILVRGPAVMQGYWERPELTAATREDGDPRSYRTGDFGRMDEQGLIHLHGRRDDQVKIRGHRLELNELATVLERYTGVAEAAAVMLDCDAMSAGHCLAAAVAPEPAARLDTDALLRHCRDWLPAYAVPDTIRVMSALPRTPTGKVDKARVRLALSPT